MLTPKQLHDYQKQAVYHQLYNTKSMLWLGTGLGKSIITLTTIEHRMRAEEVKRTLIIAPMRVLYTVWDSIESNKWEHTQHLKIRVAHGNEKKRIAALTDMSCDIVCVTPESIIWLTEFFTTYYIKNGLEIPFEMIVYDEITKFKNARSIRFAGERKEIETVFLTAEQHEKLTLKGEVIDYPENVYKNDKGDHCTSFIKTIIGWKKLSPFFKYRTGLTGTPAPNGYEDLFGQFLVLDDGKRLGKFITHYRDRFFKSDYMGYNYTCTDESQKLIIRQIQDITIDMQAKDYLDLPPVKTNIVKVELTKSARKHYKELEKEMFTVLEGGVTVEILAESAVVNKCLQLCNGTVYTHNPSLGEEPKSERVHDEKYIALDSIIAEAGGSPILLAYNYKTDADELMRRYKRLKPVNLTTSKPSDLKKIIKNWREGKIKLMIAHPASCAHGIDQLQYGGHIIVWFGLNWSLELYLQMNGRIDRQGQTHNVMIHIILVNNSVDEITLEAIQYKEYTQSSLQNSVANYRKRLGAN